MTTELYNDGLDPLELTALGVIELGQILNEIDRVMPGHVRAANDADRVIGEAEASLLLDPKDTKSKALVLKLKGALRASTRMISALKNRQARVNQILKHLGPNT